MGKIIDSTPGWAKGDKLVKNVPERVPGWGEPDVRGLEVGPRLPTVVERGSGGVRTLAEWRRVPKR